jgi:hypothetical protein
MKQTLAILAFAFAVIGMGILAAFEVTDLLSDLIASAFASVFAPFF